MSIPNHTVGVCGLCLRAVYQVLDANPRLEHWQQPDDDHTPIATTLRELMARAWHEGRVSAGRGIRNNPYVESR